MPRLSYLLFTSLLLAGCESATAPGDPAAATSSSAMEFRGERPCTDCDGIHAWLRLEQSGNDRRYRLVEDYRRQGRERRFEETGAWISEGDLLRLRSRTGGERVYARLPEGALQARDAAGRPLLAAADEVMVPVTFDTAR